jgi:hypothetical protein
LAFYCGRNKGVFLNAGTGPVFKVEKASSVVLIKAERIVNSGSNALGACGIYQLNGIVTVEAEEVSGTNAGLYWVGSGDLYAVVNRVLSTTGPAVYFLNLVGSVDGYVLAQRIESSNGIAIEISGEIASKSWISANHIKSGNGEGAVAVVGSKAYITAQKIEQLEPNGTSPAILVSGDSAVYITAQKLEGCAGGNGSIVELFGGKSFITIDECLDVTGDGDAVKFIDCGAGSHIFSCKTLTRLNAGSAVAHNGGLLTFSGKVITTDSASSDAITVSSSGLMLSNTEIVAGASATNSITGTATVEVGNVVANKPIHANVTLVGGTVTIGTEKNRGTNTGDETASSIAALIPGGYLTPQTLTSSAAISWDINTGVQASLTLAHNTTLTLSNLSDGQTASLSGLMGGAGLFTLGLAHAGLTVRQMGSEPLSNIALLTNATPGAFELSVKRNGTVLRYFLITKNT